MKIEVMEEIEIIIIIQKVKLSQYCNLIHLNSVFVQHSWNHLSLEVTVYCSVYEQIVHPQAHNQNVVKAEYKITLF